MKASLYGIYRTSPLEQRRIQAHVFYLTTSFQGDLPFSRVKMDRTVPCTGYGYMGNKGATGGLIFGKLGCFLNSKEFLFHYCGKVLYWAGPFS
jgi:hypothetical protein